MEKNKFIDVRADEKNKKWNSYILRENHLKPKPNEIRTEFFRDYNRILHSKAYRRLKHKTQVFFATQSDHICTRIEHVNLVASTSYSISQFLGLNTELTNSIAIGHDLGHAPFGHQGETILKKIEKKELGTKFWHEKNSLFVVDHIETLKDNEGLEQNLNLTYAVRDGIILHCGEVDENSIYPRDEVVDLQLIDSKGKYSPYSWEGCVVKISDKISYLGRDIEDAIRLKILDKNSVELKDLFNSFNIKNLNVVNTSLMHSLIIDLCENSSPENGICFSSKYLELINKVKKFNYKHIYKHKRMKYFADYANLIINSLYDCLIDIYDEELLMERIDKNIEIYPELFGSFKKWIIKYSEEGLDLRATNRYQNSIVYSISDEKSYKKMIIGFLSTLSDSFAIRCFGELTRF